MCVDVGEAERTVERTIEVDAGEGVLVGMAHDASLRGVVECWPVTANGWMERGWNTEGRWRWILRGITRRRRVFEWYATVESPGGLVP